MFNPTKDKRYTIQKEFTGNTIPYYVVRFCGEWIDKCIEMETAKQIAIRHHNKLIGV